MLEDDADEFIEAYGVRDGGNWEGKNFLGLTGTLERREDLAEARAKLFGAHQTRFHPGRDENVHTSRNDLMLAAFAEAPWTLNEPDYQEAAERNAKFLLHELRQENGWECRSLRQP